MARNSQAYSVALAPHAKHGESQFEIALRVSRRFPVLPDGQIPSVAVLRREFGMSRATAYRFRAAWLRARAGAPASGGGSMVDEVDRIVMMEERQLDNALAHHAQRERPAGRAFCANEDCGEAVAPARQVLGAQLCLECATDEEAQAAHFRRWKR